MTPGAVDLDAKVQRATARLAQLQAKQALRQMRVDAKTRARARTETHRRARLVAEAIDSAGFADWSPEEVRGLLLTARDQFGASAASRAIARTRGVQVEPPPSIH